MSTENPQTLQDRHDILGSQPVAPDAEWRHPQVTAHHSDSTDGGYYRVNENVPDKNWENPFTPGTPLHGLFERRISNKQDIVIIVSDWHNRRGTGKTIGSLQLAEGMDQTPEGMTQTKVSLRPEEIREAYANEPKRSALVLDESEVGATKYRASSNVNQALREIMSMGRVEEKYLIMNAPSSGHIDKDIRALADVWMLVYRKGGAMIHFLEYEPYANKELTPKKQLFEWNDIQKGTDLRNVYNYLTRVKKRHISGDEGEGFVPQSEHRKILEKAKEEKEREVRNKFLYNIYKANSEALSYDNLAEPVGLTGQRVGQIVRDYEAENGQ